MLTVETARAWANRILSIADLISQATPFTVDDEAVRRGRRLVDSDPFMEVAVEGINFVFSLFADSGNTITAADAAVIKNKIAEAKAAVGQMGS